jgi:hypothetical protein
LKGWVTKGQGHRTGPSNDDNRWSWETGEMKKDEKKISYMQVVCHGVDGTPAYNFHHHAWDGTSGSTLERRLYNSFDGELVGGHMRGQSFNTYGK